MTTIPVKGSSLRNILEIHQAQIHSSKNMHKSNHMFEVQPQRPLTAQNICRPTSKPNRDMLYTILKGIHSSKLKYKKNAGSFIHIEPNQKSNLKQLNKFESPNYRIENSIIDPGPRLNRTAPSLYQTSFYKTNRRDNSEEPSELGTTQMDFSKSFSQQNNIEIQKKKELSITTETPFVIKHRSKSTQINNFVILKPRNQSNNSNNSKSHIFQKNQINLVPKDMNEFKSYLNNRIKQSQIKIPEIKDENMRTMKNNSRIWGYQKYNRKKLSSTNNTKMYSLANYVTANHTDFKEYSLDKQDNSSLIDLNDSRHYWENRMLIHEKSSKNSQSFVEMFVKGERNLI